MDTTARPPASDAAASDGLNFLSPAFLENPYPIYKQLQSAMPLFKAPMGFWVASRHEHVHAIMKDRRFGKDYAARIIARHGPEALNEPAVRSLSKTMLVVNPPDHTRLRGLVSKAFTAKRVEEMRPTIRAIVARLLDAVADKGEMDVMRDFSYPLPVHVICEMLGVPEAERHPFLDNGRVSGRLVDPTPMSREEMDRANENHAFISEYFHGLFARRRAAPGDDLTTALVQAEEEGSRLSEEELTANILLLFAAGHETTANLIGNGLLALHRNPAQWQALIDNPGLVPQAVEELLRYDSSVQMTSRTALEDVEIDGTLIPEKDTVVCLLGAANRDPEMYDTAEDLDVTRRNIKPSSFGGGIHYCLGAQLAKIETEEALYALLERLPGLTLSQIDSPEWRQTFTLRGLTTLPATW